MTRMNIADIVAARKAEADQAESIDLAYAAGELDPQAYEAALTALTITRFPAGYALGRCPVGCSTDHDQEDRFARAEGLRTHEVTLVRLPTINGREASVVVAVADNLDDGVRGAAEVAVFDAEGLSPADTRRLTAALMDASDLAESWNAERATSPATPLATEPVFDAMAVVGTVMRLLESERVPVSVDSLERAVEDAQRLLRDLGVESVQR